MKKYRLSALLLVFLLLLPAALSGCAAKGNKDVSLGMTWRAVQEEGSDQMDVEVTFRVEYQSIEAPEASDNSYAIGGTTGNFSTPRIRSGKAGSDVIGKFTASVTRRPGETVNCPVSASYHLNSKMNGGYVGWLTFSETLRIGDENVTFRKGGNSGTDPKETDPKETEPKETDPIETKRPETEPAETDPVETKPPVTRPPETKPVEPPAPETEPIVPGKSSIVLKDGIAEWTVRTDTGTKLNLVAECEAAEREDGTVHVSVNLFLAHSSISCGPRFGCVLAVGSDSVRFDSQKISQTETELTYTFLASIDVNVEKNKEFDLEATFPFGGVYSKKQIGTLHILQTCTIG